MWLKSEHSLCLSFMCLVLLSDDVTVIKSDLTVGGEACFCSQGKSKTDTVKKKQYGKKVFLRIVSSISIYISSFFNQIGDYSESV